MPLAPSPLLPNRTVARRSRSTPVTTLLQIPRMVLSIRAANVMLISRMPRQLLDVSRQLSSEEREDDDLKKPRSSTFPTG